MIFQNFGLNQRHPRPVLPCAGPWNRFPRGDWNLRANCHL